MWRPPPGQIEVPNSQQTSCLDSSLGRVLTCEGVGGSRLDCDACHEALLEDRDDPGQVSL